MSQSNATNKKLRYFSLVLRLFAAVVFLAAGGAKLIGNPMMVDIFQNIGIGQWFRVVTGLVEVSLAIALLIPRLTGLAGLLLAITMFFAILTHLFVIGGNPLPALILLLITLSIAWLNRTSIPLFTQSR